MEMRRKQEVSRSTVIVLGTKLLVRLGVEWRAHRLAGTWWSIDSKQRQTAIAAV